MTDDPLYYGDILTPAEWKALFAGKQDALAYTPVNKAGDTMTGPLTVNSLLTSGTPSALSAGFNLPNGVTPTTPNEGDVWSDGTNIYAYVNSLTILLTQLSGSLRIAKTVDFNTAGDIEFAITLPPNCTRFLVSACIISGASHDLSTATVGLFTAASGGGVEIVATPAPVTVNTTSENTVNNAQGLTVVDMYTRSYDVATLYFNIATPEGAAATASVTIIINPLP